MNNKLKNMVAEKSYKKRTPPKLKDEPKKNEEETAKEILKLDD